MNPLLATNAKALSHSRCGRWWRWLWRGVLATGCLAFLALWWPGWPLHPLAFMAAQQMRGEGLQILIESPWLRARPDGTLQLLVARVSVGDAVQSEALVLESLSVRWRLLDLVRARWLPKSIQLADVAGTLRTDPAGKTQLIALPGATRPAASSTATPAFALADLPANLLPSVGQTLNVQLDRARLRLPPGFGVGLIGADPVKMNLHRSHAGQVDLDGSLDLHVDGRPGSAQFSGQFPLTRAWLGQFKASVAVAQAEHAPATHLSFAAARTSASAPATLELQVIDCPLGDWLTLLNRADLPRISGLINLDVSLSGDPLRLRLDSAAAYLATTALTVTQSALLVRPLKVAPLRFALHVEDNGARGRVEAFTVQAGPVTLRSPGLSWQSQGTALTGDGRVELAALPLPALMEWLPAGLRAKLGLTAGECAELGLGATKFDLHFTGDHAAGLPRLHCATRTGITVNKEVVAVEAGGDFDPATGLVETQVTLPDFVEARWELAVLRRFPIPDLDAPLRAEFKLRGRWPFTLEEVRWRIVAGAGRVVPRGPSLRWLAQPFPVSSFTLNGHLDEGLQHLAVEQMEFVSGRARLALECIELRSPQPLTAASQRGGAVAHLNLKLEQWYAADFLPLLGPGLQSLVAPFAEDLALFGLEWLETGIELSFAVLPWIDPKITALKGTQAALFRIGEERVPVDVVWRFDPALRRVAAAARLEGLRLNRLPLATLRCQAPMPLEAIELPLNIDVEVSADPFADSLEHMAATATVRLSAEKGRVKANPWLGADLPVEHLLVAGAAGILPLRFERLKVEADFGGPSLLIDDARMELGQELKGALHLRLRDVPLDWAYARVPVVFRPAQLNGAELHGRLVQLDLQSEFKATATDSRPALTALTLSADLQKISLHLPGRTAVAVQRLELSGGLDRLLLLIDRASTDGVELTNFTTTIDQPLAPSRHAQVTGNVTIDLARLPALLATCKAEVPLPTGLDLDRLAGHATVRFSASAPLDPAKVATDLRAEVAVAASKVVFPLVPKEIRLGQSSLDLQAEVTGSTVRGRYRWQPETLAIAPWIDGTTNVTGTFALTPQTVDIHNEIDLTAAHVAVPFLLWSKATGRPAGIVSDSRLTARTPTVPARLASAIDAQGLLVSPLRTRAEADLSDNLLPALNLLPGVARLQLRDTVIGRSACEFDATPATGGATQLTLRSPLFDLTEWITLVTPAITAWSEEQARVVAMTVPPAPASRPYAPPPAPESASPSTTVIPVLPLPALDFQADIAQLKLAPAQQLTGIALTAELRDGLPRRLKLTGAAGEKTRVDLQLDPAVGRQPWRFALTDVGGWLHAAAAPVAFLPAGARPMNSLLATFLPLSDSFAGGDLALQGTLDWRNPTNTLDGSIRADRLVLIHELDFLSRIAALVKKRVILKIPFKVFEVAGFTASPTALSLRQLRLEGPINLTAEYINLDLARSLIDMRGKVLGINFDVAGPLSNPSFYLTDKSPLLKGLTQENEFEW